MQTYSKARELQYMAPIIKALRELGGSGTPSEVVEYVVRDLGISEEEQKKVHKKTGEPIVKNDIHWARNILRGGGLIDGSTRGVWRLTPKGFTIEITPEVFREIYRDAMRKQNERYKQKLTEKQALDKRKEEGTEEGSEKKSLLDVLYELSPEGFERFCRRLLREAGFSKVEVTGRTGDGGIDGKGILEVNRLVSEHVIFQCKRYAPGQTVGASEVRNFRGAMSGRTDKGIFLTTARFTSDAQVEATREGCPPIELVDGEKLVKLMEELKLGVIPRTIYDVDFEFFEEYK